MTHGQYKAQLAAEAQAGSIGTTGLKAEGIGNPYQGHDIRRDGSGAY